jgi:hypothetical protein
MVLQVGAGSAGFSIIARVHRFVKERPSEPFRWASDAVPTTN